MTQEDSNDSDDEGDPVEATDGDRAYGEEIQSLKNQVEELQADLESRESSLRSVRDAQESVSNELEDIEETVRRLSTVYEQVTDDVNPFKDGDSPGDGFRFGLLDDVGRPAATDGGDLDESVGIDDLRTSIPDGGDESEEDETSRDAGEESKEEDNDDEPPTDTDEAVAEEDDDPAGKTTIVEEGVPAADDGAFTNDWSMSNERRDDPTPVSIAHTYATDVIVFEWLSELISSSSPAAAVNAVTYYRDIGWITEGTEDYLLDVLSGPHLDAGIDPNQPASLEAADHGESYAYIRKLAAVREMSGDE